MARRLADGPALAYSTTKVLLTRELDMGLGASLEMDAMTQALLMGSPRPCRVLPRLVRGPVAGVGGAVTTPRHEIVSAPGLAPAVGFAHAVIAGHGRTVFLGGQTAQGADGEIRGDTIVDQFDVAAGNLVTVLRAAGGEPDDLVSLEVFVTDVAAYRGSTRELGAVWRRHSAGDTRRWPCSGSPSLSIPARWSSWWGRGHPVSTTYAHLSEAQRGLLARSERLARDVFGPIARAGEPGRVNRPLVAALSAHGLVPEVLGRGRDVRVLDLCLIREGLARCSTEAEIAFALQGLGSQPILMAARPEVAGAWIPRVAAGEAVAAFALTEPDAGSDAAALCLAAEADGDGFRLTGEKVFVSNAPEADIYTVFARTTAGAGARGITAFAVPGDSPGLTGAAIPFVADHPIGRLRFDGVPVPASHVLGDVDHGFGVAMRALDLFRPSVGAAAVGMAQRPRRCGRPCGRAPGIRRPALRAPGREPPARRRRDPGPGCAPPRPLGRGGARRRDRADHRGRGDGQALRDRDRGSRRRRRDPGPRRRGARARASARAPLQ